MYASILQQTRSSDWPRSSPSRTRPAPKTCAPKERKVLEVVSIDNLRAKAEFISEFQYCICQVAIRLIGNLLLFFAVSALYISLVGFW